MARYGGAVRAVRRDQVLYTPVRHITVRFLADVGWTDGRVTRETLVAVARSDEPVSVWRTPWDPELPGFARAADAGFVSRLLAALGRPAGDVSLRVRAYRPGRRAVIEVTAVPERLVFSTGGRVQRAKEKLFLKVVRPGAATAIAAIHDELAPSCPVPQCLDASDELGLLVLQAMPGQPLRRSLASAPPPASLLDLLDNLGPSGRGDEARSATTDAVGRHVALLRALMPEQGERLAQLEDRIGIASTQPVVMTHGDFHEGQVLVARGRISGLLDVDGVGPGARADDLATMAGRLITMASRGGSDASYARAVYETFSERVERDDLDRRIAAVILGRATAPFRNQVDNWRSECARRIQLASSWLSVGERVLSRPA